jgi:hypothetical protein
MHPLFAAQGNPEQPVEPHEMIHMGMGNENVAQAQDLPRGKLPDIPQVEHQGPFLEQAIHIKRGVPERVVDEFRMEQGSHYQFCPWMIRTGIAQCLEESYT